MIVGVPGSGLGGLLYLVMGALMPFRELWRWLRGQSNRERRRRVAAQTVMCAAITATLGIQSCLMRRAADWMKGPAGGGTQVAAQPRPGRTARPEAIPMAVSSGQHGSAAQSCEGAKAAVAASVSTDCAPPPGLLVAQAIGGLTCPGKGWRNRRGQNPDCDLGRSQTDAGGWNPTRVSTPTGHRHRWRGRRT